MRTSLQALVVASVASLAAGSASRAQTPIAPPTVPSGVTAAAEEVPASREDLPGAWVADGSGEIVRFDAGGAFDGSTTGAGTYAVSGGVVTLLSRGRTVCTYHATHVPGRPSLRLTSAGGGAGPRCPTGTFSRESAPASASTSEGGGPFSGFGFGSRDEPARQEPARQEAAIPPVHPGPATSHGLTVTKVVSRPSNGRLVGFVAFTHPSPSGNLRIEVPFAGAPNRAAAIEAARRSLEQAAATLASEAQR